MRLLNYSYAGKVYNIKLSGFVDLRVPSAKTIRILNRFTKVVSQYIANYERTNNGVKISISQVIHGLFRNEIEVRSH